MPIHLLWGDDSAARDRAVAQIDNLARHASNDGVVHFDHGFGNPHRDSMFLPDSGQRTGVFREA